MSGPDQQHSMKNDLQFVCQVLGLRIDDVLRRAGIPVTAVAGKTAGTFPAADYFALWNACDVLYQKPDFALRLGQAMAQVPFATPIFAFYCSRNVRQGFQRLAVFKPLIGPLRYRMMDLTDGVSIQLEATDPFVQLPHSMALFEVVFLVALLRNTTATDLGPIQVISPISDPLTEDFAGCRFEHGRITELRFSHEDAARSLVTRNAETLKFFEPHLQAALSDEPFGSSVVEKVRDTLREALPAGSPTIREVALRMGISQRNLQRKLSDADTSFTKILEEMRIEIASRYLTATTLSLQEIAFLLGYNEPSSFFRAFRKLTGKTPLIYRKGIMHEKELHFTAPRS